MSNEGTPNSHPEIWKPRVTIRRWLKGGRGVNRLDNLRLLVVVADRVSRVELSVIAQMYCPSIARSRRRASGDRGHVSVQMHQLPGVPATSLLNHLAPSIC